MPKAILEFNLPEEEYEFKAVTKGIESLDLIYEIDEYISDKIKDDSLSTETEQTLQFILTKIFYSGLIKK